MAEAPADGNPVDVERLITAFITDGDYPCLGARASLRRDALTYETYGAMGSVDTTRRLHHDLTAFVKGLDPDENFAAFMAVFTSPVELTETAFEELTWRQLSALYDIDAGLYDWSPHVERDPSSNHFGFSIAEEAFFVVGMHPAASRLSRRFPLAALTFNPHAQFDRLRASDVYGSLKDRIRARDLRLQGSLNPNLADHGDASEARQYSGRAVEEDWACPFSPRQRTREDLHD